MNVLPSQEYACAPMTFLDGPNESLCQCGEIQTDSYVLIHCNITQPIRDEFNIHIDSITRLFVNYETKTTSFLSENTDCIDNLLSFTLKFFLLMLKQMALVHLMDCIIIYTVNELPLL